MPTKLNPYLNFQDTARQAMEFYKTVFGGKLVISTFEEFHASEDPSEGNKVMHAQLDTDNGITFMASDTPNGMQRDSGAAISMSLSGDDEVELRGYWDKLSSDAQVIMPLEPAPWGATYGMLRDKFGIQWMVNITAKQS